MKEINLGRVLTENRHKCGITQEELAAYIGVSKAAVSKWETGAAYPDITMLPQLAAYFNISIDELMGYEPQMTRDEIRKLYEKLSKEFASQPIEQVLEHCHEVTRKYFSCFPLLYQIGSLYVNYSALATDKETARKMLEEASELFERVKSRTDDIDLAKQALNMEALCMLSLNRPSDVLNLLGQPDFSMTATEPLLASAYQLLGNHKEAKRILQIGIYHHVVVMMNLFTIYLGLCIDDQERFDETYQRTVAILDTFQLKKLHPSIVFSFYLTAAQGYMKFDNMDKALEILEQYTSLATSNIYPLHIHGDHFFDLVDDWLENTLTLGDALPRDSKTIRESIVKSVENSKAFLPLENHPRFRSIIHKLKTLETSY